MSSMQQNIKTNQNINRNIIHKSLVGRDLIILSPLPIKLGLIKQLFQACGKDGGCFGYISKTFPGFSREKLNAGIFNGTQILNLVLNQTFVLPINAIQSATKRSYVSALKNSSVTKVSN